MMNMMGMQIGLGELLTLIAAVLKAVANLISKVSLKEVPLGIFSVYRMVIGTIVFFVVVLVLLNLVTLWTLQHPFYGVGC